MEVDALVSTRMTLDGTGLVSQIVSESTSRVDIG